MPVPGPARIRMGKYDADIRFHATALEDYDLILGKPWLWDVNPQINWRTNQLQLRRRGRPVRIQATSAARSKASKAARRKGARPTLSVCTLKTMKKLLQKGATTFYTVVQHVGDGVPTATANTEPWSSAAVSEDGAGDLERAEETVSRSSDVNTSAEEPSTPEAMATVVPSPE